MQFLNMIKVLTVYLETHVYGVLNQTIVLLAVFWEIKYMNGVRQKHPMRNGSPSSTVAYIWMGSVVKLLINYYGLKIEKDYEK